MLNSNVKHLYIYNIIFNCIISFFPYNILGVKKLCMMLIRDSHNIYKITFVFILIHVYG